MKKEKNNIPTGKPESYTRIVSIDRFRGFALLCMILFQLVAHFDAFGSLTRISSHNIEKGFVIFKSTTIADLVAPMFMFAIALTYLMSFNRRVKQFGLKKTNLHFVTRNLALIGVGTLLYTISNTIFGMLENFAATSIIDFIYVALFGLILINIIVLLIFCIKPLQKFKAITSKILLYSVAALGLITIATSLIDFVALTAGVAGYEKLGYWMVLQSLGMAGLLALPFINLKLKPRAILAGVLLFAYLIYYNYFGGQQIINAITQGGFIGGFGWALVVIIGSIFTDIFTKNKLHAYLFATNMVSLAVIMHFAFPIVKSGVRPDPTYLVCAVAISILVFLIFDLFNFYKLKFDPLKWWGKYPILLYLMEFALVGIYTEFAPAFMLGAAPLWLAILVVTIYIVGFTVIVYFLNRNHKKINF